MIESIANFTYWSWFILAVVFLVLEIFVPGTFFLWMAFGAAVTGVALLIVSDLTWQIQWLVFGVFSLVSISCWRLYLKKHPERSSLPTLNRRGEQYIGRVFTLSNPIENGIGKVRLQDSVWQVKGSDMSAGTKVKITGVDGAFLIAEKAEGDHPLKKEF